MGGRTVALVLLTLFAGGAAVAFALPEEPSASVEVVLVLDVSRTVDSDRRCRDVEAIARRIVDLGQAGTIRLWRTGERRGLGASAGEPLPVDAWELTRSVRLVDPVSRAASTVPSDMAAACAALPDTDETPLFLAVRAAVATVRAAPATYREVWVRTDGREEDDVVLRRRVAGKDGGAPRIDSAGVTVHLCGLAARRGASAPRWRPPGGPS